MSVTDLERLIDAAGRIVNGNLAGFVVMAFALVALSLMVRKLWAMVERRLAECERQHAECRSENAALLQALIDLAEGRRYEAKARAQTVLDIRSDRDASHERA